jgi:cell division protein FtsL
MTARPLRAPLRDTRLRVIPGRSTRRPATAPWIVISLVAVATFLALIASRTALDRAAFDLAELNTAIAEQATLNQQLRIEIAELENPARIALMAEELGLVIPVERRQLLVEGVGRNDGIVDPDYTAAADTSQAKGPSS